MNRYKTDWFSESYNDLHNFVQKENLGLGVL